MIITAVQDDTFDTIAYKAYQDEFYFEQVMRANWRLTDTVMFEGGEKVIVPDRIIVDSNIVASPWQKGSVVSVIKAPWG